MLLLSDNVRQLLRENVRFGADEVAVTAMLDRLLMSP
jgi:hypothetical protein